ncbi:MAG: adenylate/guanylate cyclase domain-containing protein [Rhodospirillales bacterium]|jgi:adenylate cyclase
MNDRLSGIRDQRPSGVRGGRTYRRPESRRPRVATLESIAAWMRGPALDIGSPIKLIDALCWRMVAAGLPVDRFGVTVAVLHPQFSGYSLRWWRDIAEAAEMLIEHQVYGSEAFLKSPFPPVVDRGESVRVRIDPTAAAYPYPVIADLAAQGYRDYVALPLRLSSVAAAGRVWRFQLCVFATRREGGFRDDEIAAMGMIVDGLAAPLAVATERRKARDLLSVYLGRGVAPKVLAGEIARGSGEALHAAILATDMRGFTPLTDRLPAERIVALLDAWFEGQVRAVHEAGGEVLKFMGDGMLAIFPFGDIELARPAARRALGAAREALAWTRALDRDPAFADAQPLSAVAALHVGEVFLGNIGAPDRLDFTAIGPAVNLVARLETLAKAVDRDLVLSAPFAELSGAAVEPLGRRVLKGVAEPIEAFVCAPG